MESEFNAENSEKVRSTLAKSKIARVGPTSKASDQLVPVPVMWMVSGLMALPGDVSRMVMVPVRLPAVAGVNVTKSEQDSPATRVSGQLFVKRKSPV